MPPYNRPRKRLQRPTEKQGTEVAPSNAVSDDAPDRRNVLVRWLEKDWVKTLVELAGVCAVVATIILTQINQANNSEDMETALNEMASLAEAVHDQAVSTQDLATVTGNIATSSDRTATEAGKQTAILRDQAVTQDNVYSATFAPNVSARVTGANGLEVNDTAITLSVPAQIQNIGNSAARTVTSGLALFPMGTTSAVPDLRAKARLACKQSAGEMILQSDLLPTDGPKGANYQASLRKDDIRTPGVKGYKPTAVLGIFAVICATYTSDALKGRRLATWSIYQVRETGSIFIQFAPHKVGGDELRLDPLEMLQSSNQIID